MSKHKLDTYQADGLGKYLKSYDWLFFLALFSLLSIPYWFTTKDDTFIFLQVARNIVQNGKFVFYPGRAINPITSHLWLLFVVIATKLEQYASPYFLLRVFNLICILGVFFMYSRFIKNLIPNYKGQFLCLLLFSIDPQLMRWSFIGMETPLALLLLIIFGYLLHDQITTEKINLGLPLVIWAGCTTRPEFLLAALIWVVYSLSLLLTTASKEKKVKNLISLSLFFILYTAYLFWQKIQFGSAWASSIRTKGISSSFIPGWFMKYLSSWGGSYGLHYIFLVLGIMVLFKRNKIKKLIETKEVFFVLVLLVFVFGVPLCYFLRGVFMTDRYTVIAGPLVIFTLVYLVQLSFPLSFPSSNPSFFLSLKIITISLVILLFLHSVTLTYLVQLPTAKVYTAKNYALEHIGRWLKDNTESTEKVFFIDVGVLGYYSERDVIDFLLVYPPLAAGEIPAEALKNLACKYYVFRGSSEQEIGEREKEYIIDNDRSFETVLKYTCASQGMAFGLREARQMVIILAKARYGH